MAVANPYVIPLPWRNTLLIVGGGLLLWFIPWLAWPFGKISEGHGSLRKPPVFRYIKGEKGLDGSTWSPVLMPLPTSDGFSKKAAAKTIPTKGLGATLALKSSSPLYLDMSPPALPALGMPGAQLLKSNEFEPERGGASSLNGLSGPTSNSGIHVQLPGVLRGRAFSVKSVEGLTLAGQDVTSFAMTAFVELDRRGGVTHLLLEQTSGIPAVDSAVIRALRACRGNPGTGLASGRVKVYYWKAD